MGPNRVAGLKTRRSGASGGPLRTSRAGAGGEKRKEEETGGQRRAGVVLKGSGMRGGRRHPHSVKMSYNN